MSEQLDIEKTPWHNLDPVTEKAVDQQLTVITDEQIEAHKQQRLQAAAQILQQAVQRMVTECKVDFVPVVHVVDGRLVGDVELRAR